MKIEHFKERPDKSNGHRCYEIGLDNGIVALIYPTYALYLFNGNLEVVGPPTSDYRLDGKNFMFHGYEILSDRLQIKDSWKIVEKFLEEIVERDKQIW